MGLPKRQKLSISSSGLLARSVQFVAFCAGFWMPVNTMAATRSIRRRPKSAKARNRDRSCAGGTWAVPVAAAIVGDDGVRAVLASRDVAAKRRGAAALDCAHHLHMVEADVPGIGSAPRRPAVAEDVGDLQHWTGHSCQPLRRQLGFPAPPGLFARLRQQIKRALDAGDHAGGDARVARRGV